jgi:hypothetical protein
MLAGCGSAPAATAKSVAPAVVSQATPTVTAAPASTAQVKSAGSPSLAPLASEYVAISVQADAVETRCLEDAAAVTGNLAQSELDQRKAAASDCLHALQQVVAGNAAAAAASWGPLQPQVEAFQTALSEVEASLSQMASASDGKALRAGYQQLATAGIKLRVAADAMRTALGLAPVP